MRKAVVKPFGKRFTEYFFHNESAYAKVNRRDQHYQRDKAPSTIAIEVIRI